jgi:proton-translocating NADH-quinone oxidoreductase chain N
VTSHTSLFAMGPALYLAATALLVLTLDSLGTRTRVPFAVGSAVFGVLAGVVAAVAAVTGGAVLGLGASAHAFAAIAALLVAVLAWLVDPERTNRRLITAIAVTGSLASFANAAYFLAFLSTSDTASPALLFGEQLVVDQMALLFMAITASVTALVALASHDYMAEHSYVTEYYGLVLLAATGMSMMAAANSLATVFVAMELASLPSFALVAVLKKNRGSVEAGLKYFLVGALSSSFFAYGISLIYAVTGSLQLDAVASALAGGTDLVGMLGIGTLFLIGGFAYKTASVPFHFWAPEAYEGAPAPISAFLSSASKAAGFVIAFRVFTTAFTPAADFAAMGVDWVLVFQVLAVVTMTLGNFAAATQENVKRMLAYSSIGHAGYVLIGLAALGGVQAQGDTVLGASMMHLFVYGFMNTGAFLFIALVEYWGVGRTFEDYNGLGKQAPIACAAMTVFLFSLAGLPIGGGFLSKYVLFYGAVTAGFWWLAAVGAINSALSLFYYSRVVKAMWIEEPSDTLELDGRPTGLYAAIVAAAVVTVLLLPGLVPIADVAIDAANGLLPNAGDTTTAIFG